MSPTTLGTIYKCLMCMEWGRQCDHPRGGAKAKGSPRAQNTLAPAQARRFSSAVSERLGLLLDRFKDAVLIRPSAARVLCVLCSVCPLRMIRFVSTVTSEVEDLQTSNVVLFVNVLGVGGGGDICCFYFLGNYRKLFDRLNKKWQKSVADDMVSEIAYQN
jgi:hypothetical protein